MATVPMHSSHFAMPPLASMGGPMAGVSATSGGNARARLVPWMPHLNSLLDLRLWISGCPVLLPVLFIPRGTPSSLI